LSVRVLSESFIDKSHKSFGALRDGKEKSNNFLDMLRCSLYYLDMEETPMITINILAYAKACNVDVQDMIKALQNDPMALPQFEAWKRETGRS